VFCILPELFAPRWRSKRFNSWVVTHCSLVGGSGTYPEDSGDIQEMSCVPAAQSPNILTVDGKIILKWAEYCVLLGYDVVL
jgi:hypothetical protein